MSFSPSLSLVRLQELKLWQGSYDNLLQKSREQNLPADHNSSGSASLQDFDYSLEKDTVDHKEWDARKISPTKPFEQLLEEKLAEDTSVIENPKPKRPFLKKGQGLARYRMGTARATNNRSKNVACNKQVPQKNAHIVRPKTPPIKKKGILKKTNPLYHQEVDLSPLTVPDFVKSRGTWKHVFETTEQNFGNDLTKTAGVLEEEQETLENYEEFRRSLGSGECRTISNQETKLNEHLYKTSSSKHVLDTNTSKSGISDVEKEDENVPTPNLNSINLDILQKVNEYAKKYFEGQNPLLSNEIPNNISGLTTPKMPKQLGELTLEELKMERELKIFEALEKKVDNSSFCSTNTSIANLLASTPQKIQNIGKDKIIPEQDISVESIFPKHIQKNIHVQLQEVSEKTDVLQQFLRNLQHNMQNYSLESDMTGRKIEKSMSPNTSFSDENTRWSTRSPSPSENYTEYDTTCQSDNNWKRVDKCVNTSFDYLRLDETVTAPESCRECEELRSKYSEAKQKLTDVKSENSEFKTELKDLQREYDKLKKTNKKDEDRHKEKLDELQSVLDNERKKIAKEKAYFESYVKEAQNRPSKKEREEITQLKQELADAKELLKLKDTKTGATQARLRTQIKQQEKELSEIKITVEKLQRENAKLTAHQKFARRPQEVKMLHEINKNISKLTEETLKKQINKSGNGDTDEKESISNTRMRKSDGAKNSEKCDKENEKSEKNSNNKDAQKSTLSIISREGLKSGSSTVDETPFTSLSIEQQYETMFGNLGSPRSTSTSTNIEKTERTLDDGSVEIMYSNGNLKTITADGKTIRMKYFNGDTKETNLMQQIIKYHYAAANSWHIQHPDGTEIMEFKDGQKCTKYPDGSTEVSYLDGSIRTINADGTEEQRFPDGRRTIKNLQGEQIILLPNGQREIHTQEYKRREYPDGTRRTLHKDGTVETVYANGRVRLKDANGVLVMDTHES